MTWRPHQRTGMGLTGVGLTGCGAVAIYKRVFGRVDRSDRTLPSGVVIFGGIIYGGGGWLWAIKFGLVIQKGEA